jgi:hypothetical protein
VGSGRGNPLIFVVDLGRCTEGFLKPSGTIKRGGTPQFVDFLTSSGISIQRLDDISCSISDMGKIASISSGVTGFRVCGLMTGASGPGMSGMMLYH